MKQQSVASGGGVASVVGSIANSNIIGPKVVPNAGSNKLLPSSPVSNIAGVVGGPTLTPSGQPILAEGEMSLINPNLPVSALNPALITASGQTSFASGSNGNQTNQRERAALLHVHSNSFGFFITQDSSFGNVVRKSFSYLK